MADTVIDIDGVGPVSFPDSMSEADITKAAKKLYDEANKSSNADEPAPAQKSSRSSILPSIMTSAGYALPILKRGVEELATHPNAARIGSKIGRVIGGMAPPVTGAVEAGPVGLLAGVAAASRGAWAGGRTGWFTGKLLQSVAQPIAAKTIDLVNMAKLGRSMGLVSAESDALSRLNSPEALQELADSMTPEGRAILMKHLQK